MSSFFDTICCCGVRTWLVPRAEGSAVPVPGFVLQHINAHLESCARCRRELKNLRLTTFALRKAGHKSPLKSLDTSFADRVILRVRQGEEKRLVRRQQVNAIGAALTAAAAFTVLIGWLGIFSPLSAHWFHTNVLNAPPTRVAMVSSPFDAHDPFVPSGAYASTNVGANDSAVASAAHSKSVEIAARVIGRKPILDYLSQLNLTVDPAKTNEPQQVPSVSQYREFTPVLVSSSYQLQDKRTPPAIIGPQNMASGLTIAIPSPAAPDTTSSSSRSLTEVNSVAPALSTPNNAGGFATSDHAVPPVGPAEQNPPSDSVGSNAIVSQ